MAKTLPPFSGDQTTCAKCSHTEAHTEYKSHGEPGTGSFSGIGEPDRLERRCSRCDFIWDEAINPPT